MKSQGRATFKGKMEAFNINGPKFPYEINIIMLLSYFLWNIHEFPT